VVDKDFLEKTYYVANSLVCIKKVFCPDLTAKKILDYIRNKWGNIQDALVDWVDSTAEKALNNGKIETPIEANTTTLCVIDGAKYIVSQEGYEEIREMFSRLLIASLDGEKINYIHPKFIETLKQMSPKDAKVLMLFLEKRADGNRTKILYSADYEMGMGAYQYTCNIVSEFWDEIKEDGFKTLYEIGHSIENLINLGILEKRSAEKLYDFETQRIAYENLYKSDDMIQNTFRQKDRELTKEELDNHKASHLYFYRIFVSQLGRQLLYLCLD
jgi:uncharacterized protein YlzI (FlbEa/FlbD family)